MIKRHELSDAQWEKIKPLLPPEKPKTGRPNLDHRTLLNGMIWRAKRGTPWRDLPERRVGELQVTSSFMLTGYYERPDLNEKLFQDGWYATGDMGYLADGEVYIIGRKKDLIINGGKNVYPQDLEAIVNTVPGVHPGRAVAFGVYDEREGTELIGIVAEVDDHSDHHQLAQEIRHAIASQTTVTASYVHLVDDKWLIKTSSGKIARAANRDKWLAEREQAT